MSRSRHPCESNSNKSCPRRRNYPSRGSSRSPTGSSAYPNPRAADAGDRSHRRPRLRPHDPPLARRHRPLPRRPLLPARTHLMSKGVMMVVGNVNNYAFWVELRFHYPLRKVLTSGPVQTVRRRCPKQTPTSRRCLGSCPARPRNRQQDRTADRSGTPKPGLGTPMYSRPVTVRRIKPGTAKRTPQS